MSGLGRLHLRDDLPTLLVGVALTAVAVLGADTYGAATGLGVVVALALFAASTACFLVAPHAAVAITIPVFAFIPATKVLGTLWAGPVKDALTISAALATVLYLLQRDGRRALAWTDRALLGAIAFIVLLYALNAGGLTGDEWHGEPWLQGVRLATEPLLLLLAGLLLPGSRRTLDWAAASLVATGCIVAAYGVAQQFLGSPRLAELGYSYDQQLTEIGRQLRSFGTLDDPFAYAAFLLVAMAAVIFWMKRGVLALGCGILIGVGIAVAFVQTSAIIGCALLALWLTRAGHPAAGLILFAAAASAGLALALAAAPATESQTVRAGPATYLTLNGRTTVWTALFADERKLPVGLGVGSVGRASIRAGAGVTGVSGSPETSKEGKFAVDSGYFGVVADVGLAGLAALLLLVGRVAFLLRRATRVPGDVAGWLGLGFLTVLSLDALTRDTFTGFPTAYLGFLLVGLAVAVGREDSSGARVAARP